MNRMVLALSFALLVLIPAAVGQTPAPAITQLVGFTCDTAR
jgi:hypothetical protein